MNVGALSVVGELLDPKALGPSDLTAMYMLLAEHFSNCDRSIFCRDLEEKERVILLRERDAGTIVGFTTLMRLQLTVDGRACQVLYSGDTIVAMESRSQLQLHQLWASLALSMAEERPDAKTYWYLASCGFRTYRFLPLFFQEFYPRHDRVTPTFEQHLLTAVGTRKFGDQYEAGSGIVRFDPPAPLRAVHALVPAGHQEDPNVRYFFTRNPGWSQGHGLACVAEFALSNLTAAGRRTVRGVI